MNKTLDKNYGFNIDGNGTGRYANNWLVFKNDISIRIENKKMKMTPGLFESIFHALYYTKTDLTILIKYKDLVITTKT